VRETTQAQLLDHLGFEIEGAVALRHALHANPELAHEERETARLIARSVGAVSERTAGTGLLVDVGDPGLPRVVVRAELDGLPIVEQTEAAFASTNGAMHACGHDVHAAALVALVRAANRMGGRLPTRLTALFQPSEEAYPSGAAQIVEEQALDGDVSAIVAAHVHPDVAWGAVACDPGPINASSDTVTISVRGVGAHAAYPHTGRDAILGLAAVLLSLQVAMARRLDPFSSTVLSIGRIRAGETENVMPPLAEAKGTLRALREADRERASTTLREVTAGTAAAYGCEGHVEIERGAPALANDAAIAATGRELMAELGWTLAPEWRSLGSDDLSYLGAVAPLGMAFVGLAGASDFKPGALHHPEFLPPDAAVAAVARVQAALYLAASYRSTDHSNGEPVTRRDPH
jgi:amidohydrolase